MASIIFDPDGRVTNLTIEDNDIFNDTHGYFLYGVYSDMYLTEDWPFILKEIANKERELGMRNTLYSSDDLIKEHIEAPQRIGQLLEQVRTAEKEQAQLKSRLASEHSDQFLSQAVEIQGIKVLALRLDGADVLALREAVDKLRDKMGSAVVVLAAVEEGKVALVAGVSKDLVSKLRAVELVNAVAQQVGGNGGGRPDMAQGGGTDADHLTEALASVRQWVASKLGEIKLSGVFVKGAENEYIF